MPENDSLFFVFGQSDQKTKNGMNPTHVEQKLCVKGLSENYWPVQKKKDDKEEATTQSSNESSNER